MLFEPFFFFGLHAVPHPSELVSPTPYLVQSPRREEPVLPALDEQISARFQTSFSDDR